MGGGARLCNIIASVYLQDQVHERSYTPQPLVSLTSSPDGCYCVGGAEKGAIFVWETASGRLLRSWVAHYRVSWLPGRPEVTLKSCVGLSLVWFELIAEVKRVWLHLHNLKDAAFLNLTWAEKIYEEAPVSSNLRAPCLQCYTKGPNESAKVRCNCLQ